jgi:hypothetical protein
MPTFKKKGPVWSKATKLTAYSQSLVSICLLEGHCHDAHNPRTWVLVASALIASCATSSADGVLERPRASLLLSEKCGLLPTGDGLLRTHAHCGEQLRWQAGHLGPVHRRTGVGKPAHRGQNSFRCRNSGTQLDQPLCARRLQPVISQCEERLSSDKSGTLTGRGSRQRTLR